MFILLTPLLSIYISIYRCYLLFLSIYCQIGYHVYTPNSITIYLYIYLSLLSAIPIYPIYCQIGYQGWRGWLSWDDWTLLRRTPYWHWLDARCRVTWEIPVRPSSLSLSPPIVWPHPLVATPIYWKKNYTFFFHSQILYILIVLSSIFCIITYLPFSPLLPLYRSPFPSLSPSFLSPLSSPLSFHTLR